MARHELRRSEPGAIRGAPGGDVLFRLLRDRSQEPLIVLDREGIILHISQSAAELVGVAAEDLLGESLAARFRLHATDQEPTAELLRGLPDGVQLRLTSSPVPDEGEAAVTTWSLQNGPLLLVLSQVPRAQPGGAAPERADDATADRARSDAAALEVCERACRVHAVDQWSDRELEVVRLVSHGLTTKQIARELGISARTVDKHRNSVTRKAGVETSAQLGHLYAFVELLMELRSTGPRDD